MRLIRETQIESPNVHANTIKSTTHPLPPPSLAGVAGGKEIGAWVERG
jgi:hypothetical protein